MYIFSQNAAITVFAFSLGNLEVNSILSEREAESPRHSLYQVFPIECFTHPVRIFVYTPMYMHIYLSSWRNSENQKSFNTLIGKDKQGYLRGKSEYDISRHSAYCLQYTNSMPEERWRNKETLLIAKILLLSSMFVFPSLCRLLFVKTGAGCFSALNLQRKKDLTNKYMNFNT